MDEANNGYINMEHITARLHHEVRYLEPMRLLRANFKVSEEEMLWRLAALFGYESLEDLPAPKSEYELKVNEEHVTWFLLELMVFTFAHQSARLGYTPAYFVPDVNPFLFDMDRFEKPMPGFILPFPIGHTERWSKTANLGFARASFSALENAFALGVWYIPCDENGGWVFHAIGGERGSALREKVKRHGGVLIPKADEDKMVEIMERVCKERLAD